MNKYNTNLNTNPSNTSHSTGNNPLTKNGIRQLFQLENVDKKVYVVDLKLQVINIKKNENNKTTSNSKAANEIYTASLSDGESKYTGFIIFRDNTIRALEEGDVLRILNVSSALLNQQKSRVFLIKKYEICENYPIIGNPELIKEENESKEKFPQKGAVGQQKREEEYSTKVRHTEEESKATTRPNINTPNQQVHPASHPNHQDNKYYTLLAHLTTFSKDIRLLVRVVKKTEVKTWNNFQNKTSGSLFSFTMMDQEGTEMQATAFNKHCDKFYNEIQENHVYEITGGYVRINDKKFSNVKADYKLVFDENTRVVPKEDDGTIQEQVLNYIKLSEISNLPAGTIVDVLVCIIESHDRHKITTKLGEASLKRLVVGDASGFKCEFTMWKQSMDHELIPGKIMSVKSAKVGEFNGKNIFSIDDTLVTFDPICPESNELRSFLNNEQIEWKSLTASNQTSENNQSLATKEISFMRDVLEQLDHLSDDKIGISTIKATICSFNHGEKNFYAGCPETKCKKKLTKETYDFYCIACQKTISNPTYYYTLSIRLKDASTEHWVDIFGQLGDKLFKVSCEEYKDLIINKDEVRLREITNQLEFRTFYFLCKAKNQMYNNIPKKKLNVYRIENVEVIGESRRILKNLDLLLRK